MRHSDALPGAPNVTPNANTDTQTVTLTPTAGGASGYACSDTAATGCGGEARTQVGGAEGRTCGRAGGQ